jgi:hypothetical protein
MTTDRQLFLIAGLFENRAVDARYRAEPPGRKPRDKLKRFTAYCKLRMVTRVQEISTRWGRSASWNREPAGAWVAVPIECEVKR